MFFNCGPNPLLLDSTYSHLSPFSRTSMTFQGRLLEQEDRRIRKISRYIFMA
jgi:hypothetical protein